jgi:ribonucleoside-diphosphate reductase alpha subunit
MLFVSKRDGRKELVQFDKITERISRLISPPELISSPGLLDVPYLTFANEKDFLDPILVAQKVVASLYPGITTEELDIESAEICVNLSTTHPAYAHLGGRILMSNLHKKTLGNFSSKMIKLSQETGNINLLWLSWVLANATQIDEIIDYNRDYLYDYFGFKTLEKAYLLKSNGHIIERPQDMIMRNVITVTINLNPHTINDNNENIIRKIKETYDFISLCYYTHASPTLFNSGTNHMQLSSCFLLGTSDDLSSITTTWDSCAQISKWAGGIGLHVSNIRGKNSLIKGTCGKSNGLVPFLRVFNDIARWIDQGGKRPGSIAIYLEPHHPDIFEFLDLRKNFGSETERARDLFLALWVSDLFMKQVESGGDWYLLSADECPGLSDVYGDEYEVLYWKYVNAGKFREKVEARKLWHTIMESQIETGMPYICYKDAINAKCNQKNLGTIKSSNLCAEITEYSNDKEYAVCNLASIALKPFVEPFQIPENKKWKIYTKPNCKFCIWAKKYLSSLKVKFDEVPFNNETLSVLKTILNKTKFTFPQIFIESKNSINLIGGWSDLYTYTAGTFNYDKLYQVAYAATINLDKVIDVNYYPVPQTKLSNMKHRPIGLGIQGLADTLALMRIPFDSECAVELNGKIMETIYLAALTASNDIAKSRYTQMNMLIDYFASNNIVPGEFYNPDTVLTEKNINKIYHEIKPNVWELSRESGTRTGSYSSFDGSPFSQGKFQFDLWNVNIKLHYAEKWDELRTSVITYGVRNSLLTALMPTASTSQILGNNECFEFFTNNIYTRKTQAGDFILVNKYLVNDLIKIGLWNVQVKDKIIAGNGSIQSIDEIPEELKELYKTIWEIKQIWVLKNSAARGPFVDQTQSLNIFMGEPDFQRLNSSHFWAWKAGLKTGMYYLRTRAAVDATKFTIDPTLLKQQTHKQQITEQEPCTNCSA